MPAAAVTLALFGFVLTLVVNVMRRDGQKIFAALEGRSWAARQTSCRPVTIRFNPPRAEAEVRPRWQPGQRAAA